MGASEGIDGRAILVAEAAIEVRGGLAAVTANGKPLFTPAGAAVAALSRPLAEAIAAEIEEDGVADVTQPSLYAFFATQRDFIARDPGRTVAALTELIEHDFLLHPDARLGLRQLQIAAWGPQIDLWRRLTGLDPPYTIAGGLPDIRDAARAAFHRELDSYAPAQLTVAIQAANLLKSATLGMLLACRAIGEAEALDAVAVTLRLLAGDDVEELERQEAREEAWQNIIARLLHYAELTQT